MSHYTGIEREYAAPKVPAGSLEPGDYVTGSRTEVLAVGLPKRYGRVTRIPLTLRNARGKVRTAEWNVNTRVPVVRANERGTTCDTTVAA